MFPNVTERLNDVDLREYSAGAALTALSLWLDTVGKVARRSPEQLPNHVVTDTPLLPSLTPLTPLAPSPLPLLPSSQSCLVCPPRRKERGPLAHGVATISETEVPILSLVRPRCACRWGVAPSCYVMRSILVVLLLPRVHQAASTPVCSTASTT